MSTVKANNVQIGQSGTATNNFTLYQPSTPDGTVRLAVGNSGATTGDVLSVSNTGLSVTGTLSATGNVSFDGGTFVFNESGADKDFRIEGDTDANLFFTDASTDRVGIGTSSPTGRLNVSAADTGNVVGSGAATINITNSNEAAFGRTTNLTFSSGTGVAANTIAAISGVYTSFGTSRAGALAFSTDNGSGSFTERARITSGGDLLVGTTALNPSGNAFSVDVGNGITRTGHVTGTASGTAYAVFVYDGTAIGSITQNGTTAVAYNTSSDYRLKDNPQPLTDSGAFIDALKPKTWNWKADGSRGVGFIAHEVQEVSPGSVSGEKDGEQMQAMEYGSAEFIANIIAELQSLRQRVAELEGK